MEADYTRAVRRGGRIRRLLLIAVGVLAVVVVGLNWTYGRLPAEPGPTGSFVQVGKLRIHYIEHPGAGTPVVLIHGLPGTAEDLCVLRSSQKCSSRDQFGDHV
jgi:hypothetical protein